MPLAELPIVERLTLAMITKVPEWHPEHPTFRPFPVHAWVVRHPTGVILFDTGIGDSNEVINDWYAPEIVRLDAALDPLRITPSDIVMVVLSHMHFDHCGQQPSLGAPLFGTSGRAGARTRSDRSPTQPRHRGRAPRVAKAGRRRTHPRAPIPP